MYGNVRLFSTDLYTTSEGHVTKVQMRQKSFDIVQGGASFSCLEA